MTHRLCRPLLGAGLWTALLHLPAGECLHAQGTPLPPQVDSLAAEAGAGDAESQYRYGLLLERGVGGVPVDYAAAADWYRRAVEQGHLGAMLSLSTLLLGSDPDEAIQLVVRAAELGSPEAQWRAGQVYAGRIFVPMSGIGQDRAAAIEWFTRAVEQGHHPSEEALADLYTESGDPSEYGSGAELYRRSAEEGRSAWAALRMGMMYATGEGVEEDDAAAFEWLSLLGTDGYELNPDLFSNEDLEVLGGLQSYYGVDFTDREGEVDRDEAAVAFRIALDALELMPFRTFVHPSFGRASRRMLDKLGAAPD